MQCAICAKNKEKLKIGKKLKDAANKLVGKQKEVDIWNRRLEQNSRQLEDQAELKREVEKAKKRTGMKKGKGL